MEKDLSWSDSDWAQKDRKGGTSHDNDGTQYFVCRGYHSCDMATLLNVNLCSGAKSCDYMVQDLTGNIECAGNEACPLAWIYDNEGDIVCDGNQGVCHVP